MSQSGNVHDELTVEWNQLQQTWQDSRIVWKDGVASQFGKRFIEPLESDVPAFLTKLEALENELRAARRLLH